MKAKKDVTLYAKAIFGADIVKAAYHEISNDNQGKIDNVTIEPSDGNEVHVELCNGNKFKIWASEWGGVTKL